MGSFEKAVGDN